jgi:hypothetical protein
LRHLGKMFEQVAMLATPDAFAKDVPLAIRMLAHVPQVRSLRKPTVRGIPNPACR